VEFYALFFAVWLLPKDDGYFLCRNFFSIQNSQITAAFKTNNQILSRSISPNFDIDITKYHPSITQVLPQVSHEY